jgi:hypothetical protein
LAELRRRYSAGGQNNTGGEGTLSGKELERFEEKLKSGRQI